jgi:hypothetical protein
VPTRFVGTSPPRLRTTPDGARAGGSRSFETWGSTHSALSDRRIIAAHRGVHGRHMRRTLIGWLFILHGLAHSALGFLGHRAGTRMGRHAAVVGGTVGFVAAGAGPSA